MGLATRLKTLAWIALPLLASVALVIIALLYLTGEVRRWVLTIGLTIGSTIIYYIAAIFVNKFDVWMYDRKYGTSNEWSYVEFTLIFGIFIIIATLIFSAISSVGALFIIFHLFSDNSIDLNLIQLILLLSLYLFICLLTVWSAEASYRFLFVKTRYNETHFERWGPTGRPRRFTFKQIRRAGFNPYMSTIWIEPEDGGRIKVWENEFGALGLYIKLRTTLGRRFKGGKAEIDAQLNLEN